VLGHGDYNIATVQYVIVGPTASVSLRLYSHAFSAWLDLTQFPIYGNCLLVAKARAFPGCFVLTYLGQTELSWPVLKSQRSLNLRHTVGCRKHGKGLRFGQSFIEVCHMGCVLQVCNLI
jgi:hypothetical protein